MKKTYQAFAYRQATDPDTPWIISLVAPAEELLEWAGIPRRTEDQDMAGFQRAYDPIRVSRAKKFFDISQNQSPTTVVLGIHPADADEQSTAVLRFASEDGDTIRPCTLEVRFPDEPDLDVIVSIVRNQIETRLKLSGEDLEENDLPDEEDASDDDDDEDEDEDEVNQPSPDDERDIELGRSQLVNLYRRLEDAAWCQTNHEALLDLAKPATVIDGQHRLKGAEGCERNIPFSVCALYPCKWPEQVFQFTVVNYTQKAIPDQFITANAALSLTQGEMNHLQDRLVQAGVHVTEYELMKVVHFHDKSPFCGLVNLTERKDPTKIGYKTMVRVAKEWFDARHQVFRTFLSYLYTDLPGKRAHKQRAARWMDGDWGLFFLDFWNIVHDTYGDEPSDKPGHKLWNVSYSNLVIAIVLFEFQMAFLNSVNAQDDSFWETESSLTFEARRDELRDRWRKRARIFVEWFPPDFFGSSWKQKSLSVGPGRAALQDCFTKLVTSKGDYRYAKSGLITGQTAG